MERPGSMAEEKLLLPEILVVGMAEDEGYGKDESGASQVGKDEGYVQLPDKKKTCSWTACKSCQIQWRGSKSRIHRKCAAVLRD